MPNQVTRWALALGLTLCPALGHAQQQRHQHDHAGQPPPAATLGEVHFAVGCTPEAQAAFDEGMKLQHSFWYQAAGEAFREVRRRDPGCTMAHWGEALSLLTNPYSPPSQANLRQARALLEEARRLGARSEREAAYVEALSVLYAGDDLAQHRTRLAAYRDAMARLHARFPTTRRRPSSMRSPSASPPRPPTRPMRTSSAGRRSWSGSGGASPTTRASSTT